MDTTLDDNTLSAYASTLYGYGSYSAPYWFVGMEEGGGRNFEELEKRITSWDVRGRNELEDLREYHTTIGHDKWFAPKAPLQKTWSQYIRIILAAQGRHTDKETIRSFQVEELGKTGESCLMELFPLASRSIKIWRYPEWSNLPQLQTRTAYRNYYGKSRAQHIRSRMLEHSPKAVVFASFSQYYISWWQSITNDSLILTEKRTCYVGQVGRTFCIIMHHPMSQSGVTNEYFQNIGEMVGNFRLHSLI
jgi:hypothetical protein